MCYCNCKYESYPYGPNEECICKKPKYIPCLMDEDMNEDNEDTEPEYTLEDYYDFKYDERQEEKIKN